VTAPPPCKKRKKGKKKSSIEENLSTDIMPSMGKGEKKESISSIVRSGLKEKHGDHSKEQ